MNWAERQRLPQRIRVAEMHAAQAIEDLDRQSQGRTRGLTNWLPALAEDVKQLAECLRTLSAFAAPMQPVTECPQCNSPLADVRGTLSGVCSTHGVQSWPASTALRGESREGMLTVYDHNGQYAGCIGSETWQRLIESEDTP